MLDSALRLLASSSSGPAAPFSFASACKADAAATDDGLENRVSKQQWPRRSCQTYPNVSRSTSMYSFIESLPP